jgi:hypothetical protein
MGLKALSHELMKHLRMEHMHQNPKRRIARGR